MARRPESDFDVIIAGGGVIGASIAWRLARNQVRVLLLDAAAKIGSEASSAAAGMLTPGGEFDQPSPLLDFAIGSLAQYDDFVGAIQADRARVAFPARSFPATSGYSLHRSRP
jgi:glycine/D-amino acid oxidase-like deaminating enzyme